MAGACECAHQLYLALSNMMHKFDHQLSREAFFSVADLLGFSFIY